jgi:arylsulfatase A-like enzyme
VNDLVEALIDTLKALHGLRNTMIVYASDNGFLWGDHGFHGKSVPYLPSVRVPLFVRWLGHTRPGTVDDRLVALIDLAPTILNAAGTPLPHQMDGGDVFEGGPWRTRLLLEFSTWEGFAVPTWASIVTPTLEFVEYYGREGATTFREYYDLRDDPQQLVNLLHDGDSSNDPDITGLSSDMTTLLACAGSDCMS